MDLGVNDSEFAHTREQLKLVAVHVVARARQQVTGRYSLRVTPGGFGTPEFGADLRRVRVSHDTPPTGDAHALFSVDRGSADALARWYEMANQALDRVVAGAGVAAAATPVRLWPEHFDLAIDLDARTGVRTNLGASPGDAFCDEPYLYVGPWTDARPGGSGFWNAPFGAAIIARDLAGDPVTAAVHFFSEGLARLRA
jgi:hypothetical protein